MKYRNDINKLFLHDKRTAPMLKRCLHIFVVFGLLLIYVGCTQKSYLDKNWGRSFETAKYHQILNSDASQNLNKIQDLDGQASDNNVEKYRDSFKEKGKQETVNILKLQ